MSEFQNEIDNRIRAALASLEQARADADDYLIDIRLGEIDSLQRMARDNGLHVDVPRAALIDLREDRLQVSPN